MRPTLIASIAISLALLTACAARPPVDPDAHSVIRLGIVQRISQGEPSFTVCDQCPAPTAKSPFATNTPVPNVPPSIQSDKPTALESDHSSLPYTLHIYFGNTTAPDAETNALSALEHLLHPSTGDYQ